MADKSDKVLLATSDVTVHKSQGTFESQFGKQEVVEAVVLRPGDTMPVSELAEYQREKLESDGLTGVELVSEKEAAEKKAQFDALVAAGAGTAGVPLAVQTVGLSGPDADDGSFSDHLLSDAERVANHAARAEAEAGEAGPDGDKVTVAGAEEETSPASAGRETGSSDVDEEVQGSGGEEAASDTEEGDAPEGAAKPKKKG